MLVSGRVPIQDLVSVSVYDVILGIFHIAVGLHGRTFYRIMSTLNYEHMESISKSSKTKNTST